LGVEKVLEKISNLVFIVAKNLVVKTFVCAWRKPMKCLV